MLFARHQILATHNQYLLAKEPSIIKGETFKTEK